MKIVHLQGNSGFGGSEICTLLLARGLREQGIESIVILPPGGPVSRELRHDTIETIELPLRPKWNIKSMLKIREIIAGYKPDIIHSHLRNADWFAYLGRYPDSQPPLVTTIHDFLFLDAAGAVSRSWSTKYYRWLLENKFSRIIAIADCIKRDCLTKLRPAAAKIVTIVNSIDTRMFFPPGQAELLPWQRLIDWSPEKQYIGFVGRMTKQKGHLFYVRVMEKIAARYPEVITVFIGDGPLAAELKKRCAALNLNQCIFLGYQRNFYPLYRLFTLTVIPSRWEAFGRVALESMISSTPTVASRCGGLAEIITEGEDGYLADPDNADEWAEKIGVLLTNERERKRLGQQGEKTVRCQFDLDRFTEEHIKLYRQLC